MVPARHAAGYLTFISLFFCVVHDGFSSVAAVSVEPQVPVFQSINPSTVSPIDPSTHYTFCFLPFACAMFFTVTRMSTLMSLIVR
jgi:hypothetical protein